MIVYENECVGCAVESYPCMGSSCPRRKVPHFICDRCRDDVEEGDLRDVNGEHLCIECIKKEFPPVEANYE